MASDRMTAGACANSSIDRNIAPPHCANCQVRNTSLCCALLSGNRYWWEAYRKRIYPAYADIPARETVYRSGDLTEDVYAICEGWAAIFQRLRDGRRQIVHLLIPGDFAGATGVFRDKMGHSIEALTDLRIGIYKRTDLRKRVVEEPWTFSEWAENSMKLYSQAAQVAVAVGQLTAQERIAALVMSLRDRLAARRLVTGDTFAFPLRQADIADAIGLTAVHVSRVIGTMRKARLFDIESGMLTILDMPRLRRLADVM